jgi:hypothetical protein
MLMLASRNLVEAVLTVTLLAGIAAAAQGEGQPLANFQAHCAFADGSLQLNPDDSEGLFERLWAHADAHGWEWEWDGPDFVDPARSARCPTDVLDAIAKAARKPDGELCGSIVLRLIAHTLERNGRVDDGLALLSEAQNDARAGGDERKAGASVSLLSEHAAKLAAHAGRWESALEFAKEWASTSWCGTCSSSQTCQQRALVARSLYMLGRFEDAIVVVRETVASDLTRDVRLFEIWIDCEMALKRASSADEAIRSIRAAVADADWFCDRALESWKVAHSPREAQIEHLGLLAQWHSELALPLVLSLNADQITQAMSAFDVEEGRLRHHALAELLADVGYPEVEVSLDRARRASDPAVGESTLNFIQGKFEEGKKRWNLLSRAGR